MIKTKIHHIFHIQMQIIYMDGQFYVNENFIKKYYEDGDRGYILEVDAEYPENLYNLHNDLPFYQK